MHRIKNHGIKVQQFDAKGNLGQKPEHPQISLKLPHHSPAAITL